MTNDERHNDKERVIVKAQFFYENQIKVHIRRFDKMFRNGYLIAKQNEKVYTFIDDILGETLLFLDDIYDIEEFKTPEENKLSRRGA